MVIQRVFKFSMGILLPLLAFTFVSIASPPQAEAQLPVAQDGDTFGSPFARVYEKVAPTVVRIDIKGATPDKEFSESPWDFFFDDQRQPEQRRPVSGMGSGVIIDRQGHIITNNHVIEDADNIIVKVNENDEYEAEIIGRDPETDLAVIRIVLDGELLPEENVAELGDSDNLRPGDYAVAIGNPLGLERTITVGVISALNRSMDRNPIGARELTYKDFIQTDAQINPGNSGGALADIHGRVIGINNMYAAQNAGIGFAIPINLAKDVMSQIITTGTVRRGFLGLTGSDIDRDIRESLDLPSMNGIMIDNVVTGYPAAISGLQHGDVILRLNGDTVRDYNDFLFKVAAHKPGETIFIEYFRNGDTIAVDIVLGDRDTYLLAANSVDTKSWRGIQVVDLDSPLAQNYDIQDFERGVLVVNIDPDSPASDTNLSEGDVIVEVNYQQVNTVDDFLALREELSGSDRADRSILIYRHRLLTNGRIGKGYVAVKAE